MTPNITIINEEPITVRRTLPPHYWNATDYDQISLYTQDEAGVRVTFFEKDWETLKYIARAHFGPEINNPAVHDAWIRYRTLVELCR